MAVVEDLRVERGGAPVLNGVSLSLLPGEVTVLLGRNGAGKTTLIGALGGVLAPARGTVRVAGRDPRRSRDARRRIGLVPQEIALYGRLTVAENVRCFASLAGLPRADARRRSAEALDLAQLGAVADRPVSTLSGGMQRRANIACALAGGPGLLLLDEPTAGVDADARHAIHAVLRRLAGVRGTAILLTTHDFEEAAALATQVVVIDAGSVLARGTPADLLDRVHGRDAQVVELVLPEGAGEGAERLLRREGFVPGAAPAAWWKRVRGSVAAGLGVLDDLGTRGVAVREARVRPPGLETLVLDLLARGRP